MEKKNREGRVAGDRVQERRLREKKQRKNREEKVARDRESNREEKRGKKVEKK